MRFVRKGEPDEEAARRIEAAGYAPMLAKLLAMRGIKDAKQAQAFLSPTLDQLGDPYTMKNMQLAVDAVRAGVSAGKRIVVFGDYDVDGVTATASLLSHLRDMGAKADYYLPDRHGEGYGLNDAAILSLAASFDMMITVDCGITAVHEVETAKQAGLEVIITDHHEPLAQLPDCICLNPKLGYSDPELCGAGVVGKLVQALGGREALEKVIDLVAMGTIADIVPLLGENRVLALKGLARINEGARPGIAALAEVASLLGKPLTAGHISFAIAPRINAGGRMGHSGRSVDMMLSDKREEALEIARELDDLNRARQQQEQEIFVQAQAQIDVANLPHSRCLVLVGEGWNPGVIGIVASRMVEKYHRPTFLLALEGDCYVGSGRSLPGVHLFELLQKMPDLFVRFGGHAMAAGLTLRKENADTFRRALEDALVPAPADVFLPTAYYDMEATLSGLDVQLVHALDRLSPMGQGNPTPVFLVRDVRVSGQRTVGAKGAHLRFNVEQGGKALSAIAFKQGDRLQSLQPELDVLITPEIDSYSGEEKVRLLCKAFAPAKGSFAKRLGSEADALLCAHIDTLPFSAKESGGFRTTVPIKGGEDMKKALLGMLDGSRSGLVIACALPQTAQWLDAWLSSTDYDDQVRRVIGPLPEEEEPPNVLWCPPNGQDGALGGYRQIVLADGVWSQAWLQALQAKAQGMAVFVPQMGEQTRQALSAIVPDIEKARAIFRALRQMGGALPTIKSIGQLAHKLPGPQSQTELCIALHMLKDMKLITYAPSPLRIALAKNIQGKRDFAQTDTYRFFQKLIKPQH